jgi:uncharacterized protein
MQAVVTGASAGIGQSFARALAARGYDLVLVARREERLKELAAELEQKGRKAVVAAVDLSRPEGCERAYEIAKAAGPTDLLINNAGFGTYGALAEADITRTLDMIRLNVESVVHLTRLFVPEMAARRKGAVIQVASTGAFQAVPYMAAYTASKSFVLSFTMALAVEMKAANVSFKVLCPGPTATEFNEVAVVPGEVSKRAPLYMSSEKVVEIALRDLGRRRVVLVPGVMNKAGAFLSGLFPRGLVTYVSGQLLKPSKRKALP